MAFYAKSWAMDTTTGIVTTESSVWKDTTPEANTGSLSQLSASMATMAAGGAAAQARSRILRFCETILAESEKPRNQSPAEK